MKKKEFVIMDCFFIETDSEAKSMQRALDVLTGVTPLLSVLRKFWSKRIVELFKKFVNGDDNVINLIDSEEEGLRNPIFIEIFESMCTAYLCD